MRPAGGVLTAYDPPTGPGVRTDGYGYAGYATSPSYDSLVAKVIGHAASLEVALRRTDRALAEFRLEGAATNLTFLRALLGRPELAAGTENCPRGCSHDEEHCALDAWVAQGHAGPSGAARLESLRRLLRSRLGTPEEE